MGAELPLELILKVLKDADTKTLSAALKINHLWQQGAAQLLYQQPKLTSLRQVRQLKRVIDKSMDGFTSIKYHNYIRGIDVSNLEDSSRSDRVVGEWIIQLIKMTKKVAKIDSAMDLMTLTKKKSPNGGQLKFLDMGFCKAVRNNEFIAVKEYCTKLESLNLSGGSRSDRIMISIAPKTTNLKKLSLAWNVHLSDLTLFSIAQNCHKLQSIDLSHCTDISDDGIKAIALNCPIRYMSVNWCSRITLHSLSLVLQTPTIQLLNCVGTDCDVKDIKLLAKTRRIRINELDTLPFYENK